MLPFRGWPVQPFRTQPFSIGGFPCQAFSTVNPKEPDVASTAGEIILTAFSQKSGNAGCFPTGRSQQRDFAIEIPLNSPKIVRWWANTATQAIREKVEVIPKKEADEVCQLALRVADRILRLVKGLLDIDQYRVGTMAGEAMSGKAQSRVAEGGRISQPRSVELGKVREKYLIVKI